MPGRALKKSMAAERSSMLAAIEKIKPNLAALVSGQPGGRASETASIRIPWLPVGSRCSPGQSHGERRVLEVRQSADR